MSDIYFCMECPGMICQTNDSDQFCQDRKPFARWEKHDEEAKVEKESVLVLGIEDAERVIREARNRRVISDYEAERLIQILRLHTFFAKPQGLLLNRNTDGAAVNQ